MKKHIKPIAWIALALSALVLVSCSPTAKIKQTVKQHLTEQYGEEREFELIDYEQSRTTSGRYVVNMKCTTDDTLFTMYVSSTMISDSYGVRLVNEKMEGSLFDNVLTDGTPADQIGSIEWLSLYKDGAENFIFREIDPDAEYGIDDIKKINEITLRDQPTVSAAAGVIYEVFRAFDKADIELDDSLFTFLIDGLAYKMTCDSATVLANTKSEFVQKAIIARDDIVAGSFLLTGIELKFVNE
ncbi:MAG: hypothetical protein MJ101_04100 [Clostridia bacterium]|nr:hypothetical protein [Clostridia bacterium]